MGTLSHKGYEGSAEVSVEDRCLFGQVLGVRSLISYGGDTFDELERCFREAVDEYLADCAERGVVPELPIATEADC